MRKTSFSIAELGRSSMPDAWLDLESIAAAEISSEDPAHPFEAALQGGRGGWRAAAPGPQVVRLRFDQPADIRRIRLEFREAARERSQEFCLSATSASGQKHEIARQQWNFSPGGSTAEAEDYAVQLAGIAEVTLEIDPGRHDRSALATLQFLAIAGAPAPGDAVPSHPPPNHC